MRSPHILFKKERGVLYMNVKQWRTAAIAALIAVTTVVFLFLILVFWRLGNDRPEQGLGLWICLVLTLGSVEAAWLSLRMGNTGLVSTIMCAILYLGGVFVLACPFGGNFTFNGFLVRFCFPLSVSLMTGIFIEKQGMTRQKNRRKAARYAGKIYKGKR